MFWPFQFYVFPQGYKGIASSSRPRDIHPFNPHSVQSHTTTLHRMPMTNWLTCLLSPFLLEFSFSHNDTAQNANDELADMLVIPFPIRVFFSHNNTAQNANDGLADMLVIPFPIRVFFFTQ
jgi:hypothetical protein